MTRKSIKLIHEGKYAAEVPIELIEDDTAWSPYLSPEEVRKLDTVRLALKHGDLAEAAKYGRVFELKPVAAGMTSTADWTIDLGPEAWPGLDPGASDRRQNRRRRHARADRRDEGELHRAVSQAGAGAGRGIEARRGGGVDAGRRRGPAMVDERFTELLMPTLDAFSEMLRTVKPMVKMEDVDDILVADFSSIKNNDARQVIERLYSMSIRANKAIHEVHSVYNDMQLCQLMSRRFPWRKGTFKRSDHLHFSWMLFVNLCYLFRLKLKQAYNVAQPLAALSKGANKFDVASELKLLDHKIGRHIRARGEHWHQWNVGHKWIKDYRMFEFLTTQSRRTTKGSSSDRRHFPSCPKRDWYLTCKMLWRRWIRAWKHFLRRQRMTFHTA